MIVLIYHSKIITIEKTKIGKQNSKSCIQRNQLKNRSSPATAKNKDTIAGEAFDSGGLRISIIFSKIIITPRNDKNKLIMPSMEEIKEKENSFPTINIIKVDRSVLFSSISSNFELRTSIGFILS